MHRALVVGLSAAALAATASAAAGYDRRVRIENASHHAIVSFFGAKMGTKGWQDSLLGDDVLPAGGSVVLNFDDGSGYCRFRFRAVFDDGVALERNSINVCEVGTYRYTD